MPRKKQLKPPGKQRKHNPDAPGQLPQTQAYYTSEKGWTPEGIAEQERRRLKQIGRNPHPFADIEAL